jgi:succinate dehydrogenase cytochrome b556 subunit
MMTKKARPLSPHLSIYKPQISSVLSIAHRVSGVVNFIGIAFMMANTLAKQLFTNFLPRYLAKQQLSFGHSLCSSTCAQALGICFGIVALALRWKQ